MTSGATGAKKPVSGTSTTKPADKATTSAGISRTKLSLGDKGSAAKDDSYKVKDQ